MFLFKKYQIFVCEIAAIVVQSKKLPLLVLRPEYSGRTRVLIQYKDVVLPV